MTLCDELEDDATEADQAEAAVHQDPAAPTSSTRKPDGWGSRSICKMLESLVVADIEGKEFSVGHKIPYLVTGGGDNWMWKQRNRKASIEQFANAMSPESEEDSDSRDSATMVAIVRGKESPEMVRVVLEFVESQLDEMEKVDGKPSLTIDGVICTFSFVLTVDAAFTLDAIGQSSVQSLQGQRRRWGVGQA